MAQFYHVVLVGQLQRSTCLWLPVLELKACATTTGWCAWSLWRALCSEISWWNFQSAWALGERETQGQERAGRAKGIWPETKTQIAAGRILLWGLFLHKSVRARVSDTVCSRSTDPLGKDVFTGHHSTQHCAKDVGTRWSFVQGVYVQIEMTNTNKFVQLELFLYVSKYKYTYN